MPALVADPRPSRLHTRKVPVRRPPHRLLAAVAAAGLVVLLAPAAAVAAPRADPTPSPSAAGQGAASGDQRATFGIGPMRVGSKDPFFSYVSAPGGVYADTVGLFNFAAKPITLSVYPADLANTADGSISATLQKDALSDVGGWIQLSSPVVTVTVPAASAKGPGAVELPFRVAVPASITPGDHTGAIVASLRTLGKNPQGQNIYLDQRIGARVYIRLAGDVEPALSVTDVRADYAGSLNPFSRGTAVVTYRVTNTGNVRLGVHQTVTVKGVVGPEVASEPLEDIKVLLPGGTATVTTRVDGIVPLGLMTASVVVDGIAAEASEVSAPPSADGSTRFWAIPWLLLSALLLLALAVAWWVRRRRAAEPEAPTGRRVRGAGPDGSGDLVGSVGSAGGRD